MSTFDALRYRLHVLRRALFRREEWRREMDAELTHHLELETMQRRHAGATDEEARAAARHALGDPRRVRERIVDDSGASALDALRQDLRFAARALRTRPGFTLAAVLTLAVGIGGNAAIFSAVNAMLLRRLPYPQPERLMKVGLTSPGGGIMMAHEDRPWSYPKFAAFRDARTTHAAFDDLTLYSGNQFTLREGDDAERLRGEYVDARYLPMLGVRPALGRAFARDEDRYADGPRVALLGDALWRRRFGADPAAVGRAVDIGGQPYTVVGVLPPGFRGLTGRAELWLPVLSQSKEQVDQAWNHGYTLVARRKQSVSTERAAAAALAAGRVVDEAYPNIIVKGEHWGARATPLDASRVDPTVRRALLVLLGAVGLVLLIACANVANLLLVRAAGRQREIAVRVALGAGRGRLVRQLLTESVLLSALGGVAGIAIAWWGARLLAAADPTRWIRGRFTDFGAVAFDAVHLDAPALALIAALAVATGIVFGLAPALHATRPAPGDALRAGARGASSRGAGRSALAAAELALALVLLAGSGLMLRSLGKLLGVDPGVDPTRVLALRLGARPGLADDSLPGFYQRVVERVAALPGVTGAALQDCPPLDGGCNLTSIFLRDRPAAPEGREPEVGVHWITPDWPAVMRVPLRRGRAFTDADRDGAPKVVLVSETAARRFWPGADPIGKGVGVGQGGFWDDTARVVGVVGDVRYATPDAPPLADVYLPYYQSQNRIMLFARTTGDPLALVGAVRRVARELAPGAPVFEIGTLEGRFADALAFARFGALLLSLFAAVALALAMLGVYGVIAFATAQRTREIGVRVALGATRRDVVRLIARQGVAIALAGAAVGLAGALAGGRVLRSLLYDVAPSDPATFAGVVALLLLAVALASWGPARRAAGVAPTQALHAD